MSHKVRDLESIVFIFHEEKPLSRLQRAKQILSSCCLYLSHGLIVFGFGWSGFTDEIVFFGICAAISIALLQLHMRLEYD